MKMSVSALPAASFSIASRCFQRAQAGRADGDDAAVRARAVISHRCRRDGEVFRMHAVFGQVVYAHRLVPAPTCSVNQAGFDPLRGELREQGLVEMQAGGRRGDGAGMACVDRLIARFVF